MEVRDTALPGVKLIIPQVFGDNRGWFCETYNKEKLAPFGLDMEFIQDNQSLSVPVGTLRGIHFQNDPFAQSKLVRCVAGRVFDVAVDPRKGSPTYGQWVGAELSAENKHQLFIPKGFGHAFMTLEENSQVCYKVDAPWSRPHERTVRFDDPEIAVAWPLDTEPVMSDKDKNAPTLQDCDCNFTAGEGAES